MLQASEIANRVRLIELELVALARRQADSEKRIKELMDELDSLSDYVVLRFIREEKERKEGDHAAD